MCLKEKILEEMMGHGQTMTVDSIKVIICIWLCRVFIDLLSEENRGAGISESMRTRNLQKTGPPETPDVDGAMLGLHR